MRPGVFSAPALVLLLCCGSWLGLHAISYASNAFNGAEPLPPSLCDSSPPSRSLVFVSTLDGYVTAIDSKEGVERWSFDTGSTLLSSSIHRLELSNDGQWMRLVPSLSGSLYRFSGDSLEPLPVSADQLLSSSYKYSDDLVVAGSKETISYGLSTNSGDLVYKCSVSGCVNNTNLIKTEKNKIYQNNAVDSRELVIVRSITQTVRAFEPRSGHEKWNFSVGQHDFMLQPFEGCTLKNDPIPPQDILFKVIVPEGLICAVQKSAPQNVLWKHKLSSPIVNAWSVDGSKLSQIDLFGASHIPSFDSKHNPHISPSLYIGMYERQLYIQESVRMQALVQSLKRRYIDTSHTKNALIVPWKPIPARKISDWNSDTTALSTVNEKDSAATALSILYASEYVNGNGYYLYTEEDQKLLSGPTCGDNSSLIEIDSDLVELNNHDDDDDNYENIPILVVSLWYWWKEVTIIAASTALLTNYLFNRLNIRDSPREVIHTVKEYVILERVEHVENVQKSPSGVVARLDNTPSPFISRYLNDFTPIKCLGRGGFGVVFEAINKIDECHYAVKRIVLPNKKEQRQRVLREVRALAKLDHANIVRYFNSWLEEPPSDWIDPYEQELCADLDFTETYSKVHSVHNNNNIQTPSKKKISPSVNENSYSIDVGFDALQYDISNSKYQNRQRSYSMNDSFSVVFENSKDKSSSYSMISADDSNDGKHLQKMFYISSGNMDEIDGGEIEMTQQKCEIVNESLKKKKEQRKHRRNLSLDLDKIKQENANASSYGKVFLYIQMQLCQEKSLREWLKDNLSLETRQKQFVNMFEQIVWAVEYVHLRHLIHRDLKPSNIFFSADGQIKIGDFGLVTTMTDPLACEINKNMPAGQHIDMNNKFTQHVGTHLYMSPEQIRGDAHNFKVDIWSLGLVLLELLIPFHTEMEKIKVLKDVRENKFPRDFHAKFPNEYNLLQLMLSPDPEKRPSTLGIRARPPLLHDTDSRYHFCLPPHSSLPRSSTSSISM